MSSTCTRTGCRPTRISQHLCDSFRSPSACENRTITLPIRSANRARAKPRRRSTCVRKTSLISDSGLPNLNLDHHAAPSPPPVNDPMTPPPLPPRHRRAPRKDGGEQHERQDVPGSPQSLAPAREIARPRQPERWLRLRARVACHSPVASTLVASVRRSATADCENTTSLAAIGTSMGGDSGRRSCRLFGSFSVRRRKTRHIFAHAVADTSIDPQAGRSRESATLMSQVGPR